MKEDWWLKLNYSRMGLLTAMLLSQAMGVFTRHWWQWLVLPLAMIVAFITDNYFISYDK